MMIITTRNLTTKTFPLVSRVRHTIATVSTFNQTLTTHLTQSRNCSVLINNNNNNNYHNDNSKNESKNENQYNAKWKRGWILFGTSTLLMMCSSMVMVSHSHSEESKKKQPIQSIKSFQDALDWLNDYYENPNPDLFVPAIQKLLSPEGTKYVNAMIKQKFRGKATKQQSGLCQALYFVPIVGFMSYLFSKYPEKTREWFNGITEDNKGTKENIDPSLSPTSLTSFALFIANTPEANEILNDIVKKNLPPTPPGVTYNPDLEKNTMERFRTWFEIQMRDPIHKEGILIGKFLATGNSEHVKTLLGLYSLALDTVFLPPTNPINLPANHPPTIPTQTTQQQQQQSNNNNISPNTTQTQTNQVQNNTQTNINQNPSNTNNQTQIPILSPHQLEPIQVKYRNFIVSHVSQGLEHLSNHPACKEIMKKELGKNSNELDKLLKSVLNESK